MQPVLHSRLATSSSFRRLHCMVTPSSFRTLNAPGRAADFCERFFPQAKLMVFGHTHWPGVWQRGGRTVMNAGGYLSLGGSRVVDLDDGKVSVRKVGSGDGGVFVVKGKALYERDFGS